MNSHNIDGNRKMLRDWVLAEVLGYMLENRMRQTRGKHHRDHTIDDNSDAKAAI